jgi:hypothetical protein
MWADLISSIITIKKPVPFWYGCERARGCVGNHVSEVWNMNLWTNYLVGGGVN